MDATHFSVTFIQRNHEDFSGCCCNLSQLLRTSETLLGVIVCQFVSSLNDVTATFLENDVIMIKLLHRMLGWKVFQSITLSYSGHIRSSIR